MVAFRKKWENMESELEEMKSDNIMTQQQAKVGLFFSLGR
jgi:hypothetical protein